MNYALRFSATAFLTAALAACDSIGEGNTIEKLEVIPATTATQLGPFEQGDTYKLFQCLRDELFVIATFTDGTQANFSRRATWSTSDPAVVEVSNGDTPAVFAVGNPDDTGAFYVHPTATYAAGTVIPKGNPGQTAVVTARFASLSATMNVTIRKPTLRVVAVPLPAAATPPYALAQGTTQRLAVLVDADGRTVKPAGIVGTGSNGFNINPFRWVFTGGTFVPEDDAVSGDVDKWTIDAAGERIATLHAFGVDGLVSGVKADFTLHEVAAESYLCPLPADPVDRDAALHAVADVQVAEFADASPLVVSYEAGFNGAPFEARDQVIGTSQQLEFRGQVDTDNDGDMDVVQNLKAQGTYVLQPLDASCADEDTLLNCTTNSDFAVSSGGLLATTTGAADNGAARLQACFPFCLQPLASLTADATAVNTGDTVTFTATAIDVPADVATVNYLFDFGDGTTPVLQAGATASHPYTTAGGYTATVRLVDAAHGDERLSQNAGAARVLVSTTPPAGNTAPTAVLKVSSTFGDAPLLVALNASSSDDADATDAITVYEFDPGDGTPVIRQSGSVLRHVYLDGAGGPFTPTVRVYDQSGVASAAATDTPAAVTVNGVAAPFLRSSILDLRARKATLCSVEVQPPLAPTPTQAAFTFPGLRFEALGSFVADTDTETCNDAVIGTQSITRFIDWAARPAGVTDQFSDVVGVLQSADDFESAGQVVYFRDVDADTALDITADPLPPFSSDLAVPSSALTVQPCAGCTP